MRAAGRGLAVVGYVLRACVPPRRWAGLALLGGVAALLGLLARLPEGGGAGGDGFARIAAAGLFGLVLPLVTLVVGDAALGAEVRRGTFGFTWLAPVGLGTIVVGRWVGGLVLAVAVVAPAFALAAVLGGAPAAAGPAALGAAAGAVAYLAVFLAVGAWTRRSAVVSLLFVFLVERLLGGVLSGVAQLSPSWEARAVFTGLADVPADLVRDGIPVGWSAVGRLALITAVALAVARWRLARLRLAGASD